MQFSNGMNQYLSLTVPALLRESLELTLKAPTCSLRKHLTELIKIDLSIHTNKFYYRVRNRFFFFNGGFFQGSNESTSQEAGVAFTYNRLV